MEDPKATRTHTNIPIHTGAHEHLTQIQNPHHMHHHHHQRKYPFPLASDIQAMRCSILTPRHAKRKLSLREHTRPNQLYGMPNSVVNLKNASLDSLAGLDVR